MVLPAPAPHDEAAPPEATWLDELTLALRLSQGAILVHVDHARPERLGELVRAIAREHPDVDVAADVRAATTAPEGSVLVLLPEGSDAAWLNLQRPVFKRRELKVVLFCDHETSAALAQEAPDFFDWISVHQDCPPGPAMHAVLGLRAALAADAPVAWNAPGEPADIERVWGAFSIAFPGQSLRWLNPKGAYDALVEDVRRAGDAWVACCPRAATHLRRFRWALAEAGRRSRALVVTDALPCPGYWPVHDRMMSFAEARRVLEEAGAKRAGALAALTGLEPEAGEIAGALLGRGEPEERLIEVQGAAEDPGAALARVAHKDVARSLELAAERKAPAPWLRACAGDPEVRRLRAARLQAIEVRLAKGLDVAAADLGDFAASCPAPGAMRGAPDDIEPLGFAVECMLRRGPKRRTMMGLLRLALLGREPAAAAWIKLAAFSLAVGEPAAAGVWALRAVKEGGRPPLELDDVARQLALLGDPGGERLASAIAARRGGMGRAFSLLKSLAAFLGMIALIYIVVVLYFGVLSSLDQGSVIPLPTILLSTLYIFMYGMALLVLLRAPRILVWILGALRMRRSLGKDMIAHQVDAYHRALERGDHADVARELKRLRDDEEPHLGVEHPLSRSMRRGYAIALSELDDPNALIALDAALALEGRIEGVEHGNFAALIPALAAVFVRTGRAIQAEALLRKLLGPDARLPGEGDLRPPAEIGGAGMSSEAEGLLALFLSQPGTPALSPSGRVGALRLLAEALLAQGRYDEAEALLERALASLPELPSEHREQWCTLSSLGQVLDVQGRTSEALEVLRRAAARAEAGPAPARARVLKEIARVEHRLAAPEAAAPH